MPSPSDEFLTGMQNGEDGDSEVDDTWMRSRTASEWNQADVIAVRVQSPPG